MWIYIPESCLSAPDMPGWTLESESLVQKLARSVTWRGKHSPSQTWSRRCKHRSWMRLLSIQILPSSMASHGADGWISSLEDRRAKDGPSQESARARLIRATFGLHSPTSCETYAPTLSSSRTRPRSSAAGTSTTPSSPTWRALVIAANRDCLRRRKSARRTTDAGSSSWPSPRRADTEGGPETKEQHQARGAGGLKLNDVALQWQTPGTDSFRSRGGDRKDEEGLSRQVKGWPTPKANDPEKRGDFDTTDPRNGLPGMAKDWSTPNTGDGSRGAQPPDGKRGMLLDSQVRSHQGKTTPTRGDTSSTDTPTSGPQEPRVSLNPWFTEWLMGWPPGQTVAGDAAKAWFPLWLRLHSDLCWRVLLNGEDNE